MCFIKLSLTGTSAQVFDIDLLLLHTRRLSDQTGVVVRVSVCGAHRVLVVTAAVDVTDAPEERDVRHQDCFSLEMSLYSVLSQEPGQVSAANH